MKIKPAKTLKRVMLEVNPKTQPLVASALFRAVRKLPAVRLKKFLVTTDFSASSQTGVRSAVALARKLDAAIEVLYVVEPPVYFTGASEVVFVPDTAAAVAQAKKQLARVAQQHSKPGSRVTPVVRQGKPFHEIAAQADEDKVDLIVIATRGRTGMRRVLLGSTAERVVRHAPCPVLTVPSRAADERAGEVSAFRLRRIIVPVDFSATSAQALPYAAALAGRFAAEIILLHVVEPMISPSRLRYVPTGIKGVVESLEPAAREQLTGLGEEAFDESVSLRSIVRTGVPFQEIAKAAKSLGADLIVLTTHGYTGLRHVVLGSTAERVLRHADCPVMVVRGTARDSKKKRN